MGRWKKDVQARLQWRDQMEKLPFVGVFTSLSHIEEKCEARQQILAEIESKRLGTNAEEVNVSVLHLQMRESEILTEKLSQTVSDLTAVLKLKEAEIQYWQSRVFQYREEALTLAKGSKSLKEAFSELEFTVECQAQELFALRTETRGLKEALDEAWTEKETFLQRWMEEKSEEADRLNKYNDAQERWQDLAKRMKKQLKKEMRKECAARKTSATVSPSATQGIGNETDAHQEPTD